MLQFLSQRDGLLAGILLTNDRHRRTLPPQRTRSGVRVGKLRNHVHDGVTLNDLVFPPPFQPENITSPMQKGNRDRRERYRSWNCAIEARTDDPAVESLQESHRWNNFPVCSRVAFSFGITMIHHGRPKSAATRMATTMGLPHVDESVWFDWTLLKIKQPRWCTRFCFKLLIQDGVLRDLGPGTSADGVTQLISPEHTRAGKVGNTPTSDWNDNSHSYIRAYAQLPGEDLLV